MPSTLDLALVSSGTRFTAEGLLHARDAVFEIVAGDPARFAKFKVDAAWRKKVDAVSAKIDGAIAARNTAEGDAVPATVAYNAAFADAKQWRDDCMTYADGAFDSGPEHQKFRLAAAKVGDSSVRLIACLGKLAALASTFATKLKAEGASPKFASEGLAHAAALKKTKAAHEAALKALSPKQQAAHQAKGELYALLKRASLVARRQHLTGGKSVNVAVLAGKRLNAKPPKGAKPPAAPGTPPAAPSP